MSVVARIPEEVAAGSKTIAKLQGRSPNDVLVQAWREYIEHHRAEIAAGAERAAQLLRDGDMDGLIAFAGRDAKEWAAQAGEDVRC